MSWSCWHLQIPYPWDSPTRFTCRIPVCLCEHQKTEMQAWRVLVVEDNQEMQEFFAGCITRSSELQLAGRLGTVAEAKRWIDNNASALNVLLIDLGLPDGSGLDVIRYAMQRNPACEVLVISMFGDEDNVLASIEAGALGYIHKDATPDDIADAILAMRRGESPISPMIARRVLSKYRLGSPAAPQEAVDAAHTTDLLSPKELEVLSLIARGFSYGEIARIQALSVHTVQSHIKKIYSKLAVHSKNEAVFEATRMGLLSGKK